MTKRQQWVLQSESSPDGTGRFFDLECGDISSINYNNCGIPQLLFDREPNNGVNIPVDFIYSAQQNTAVLTVPESEADWLIDLHKKNCATDFRRVNCATGEVHHYIRVMITGEVIEGGTAQGVGATGGVVTVSFPITFFDRIIYNRNPHVEIAGFNEQPDQEDWRLIRPIYCSCPSCQTGGCGVIWRLWYREDLAIQTFKIWEYSTDGGETWTEVDWATQHPSFEAQFFDDMYCYNGRLYMAQRQPTPIPPATGTVNPITRIISPLCGDWFVLNDPAGYRDFNVRGGTPAPGPGLAPYRLFGDNMKMYALSRWGPGDANYEIARFDGWANNWSIVWRDFNAVTQTSPIIDGAASGNVVAVVRTGPAASQLIWSTQSGASNTWFTTPNSPFWGDVRALAMYNPDPLKPSEAVLLVAKDDYSVYKVILPERFNLEQDRQSSLQAEELYSACEDIEIIQVADYCRLFDAIDPDPESTISLIPMANGRGFWWGRELNNGYGWVFNDGGGCVSSDYIEVPEPGVNDPVINFSDQLLMNPCRQSETTLHTSYQP